MSILKSNRKDDLSDHMPTTLNYNSSHLLGSWHNSLSETGHIIHLDILEKDSKLYIHAFGAGEAEPYDWGLAELSLFNSDIGTNHTEGFTAHYDFGHCETHLAGLDRQNVMVISSYTTFKDGSKRHNYYIREFYYKK